MGSNNKNTLNNSGSYDDDLIARLYDTHVNDLFVWGKTFTNDHKLIKDGIQNLFIYLLTHRKKLKKYSEQESLSFSIIAKQLDKPYKRKKFVEII